MPLAPGQTINNRYRIVKLLGQGGFGAVYRAWDTNLQRPCALKENLAFTAEAQQQFEREARILSNLSHPGLPRVTDHFMIPGQRQYLVMDYIEGQDLQQMLAEAGRPLPEAEVLSWITQVCDALVYLHSQQPPIIHRDIKPANIKITPDGRAMLVDFGIAKIYDPHLKTTLGARAFTPGYSPHEQYGQGVTDERTDIYALGATLYHILTGQEPVESIQRILRDPLVAPEQLNPSISNSTSAALKTALNVDPERRFQNAAQFKSALLTPARPSFSPPVSPTLHAAAAPPVAAGRQYPAPPSAAAASQSPPAWIWIAGFAGLAMFAIVFLVGIFWALGGFDGSSPGAQGQTEAASLPTTPAPGPSSTLPAAGETALPATAPPDPTRIPDATKPATETLPSQPATAPQPTEPPPTSPPAQDVQPVTQGKWVAYALGDKQIHRDLFMVNLNNGQTSQLTSTEAGNNGPTFSPDGRRLAYAGCRGADCQIYLLDTQTQYEEQLTRLGFNAMFPDWCKNPAYPWIIFEGREGAAGTNLWMVDASSGDTRRLTESGGDGRPSWSPDCSQVVFGRALADTDGNGKVTTSDRMDPYILDLATLSARPVLTTPEQDEFQFAWSPDGDWIAFCRISQDTTGDRLITLDDQSDLLIIRPDGSQERNLTQGKISVFSPSWSPDGAQIVFSEDLEDTAEQILWILTIATTDFTALTDQGDYFHPVWSP
jgi:serine/threonine protein kinase